MSLLDQKETSKLNESEIEKLVILPILKIYSLIQESLISNKIIQK